MYTNGNSNIQYSLIKAATTVMQWQKLCMTASTTVAYSTCIHENIDVEAIAFM